MRRAWLEFKEGWHEANWGGYFLIALFPLVIALLLVDSLFRGKIPSSPGLTFLLLSVPAVLVSLYWAGLRSGLDNWLGRLVFTGMLVLVLFQLIRQMERTGERKLTTTRRIGRHEVTLPVELVVERLSEDEAEGTVRISQRAPQQWWAQAREVFETLALAFQNARNVTW